MVAQQFGTITALTTVTILFHVQVHIPILNKVHQIQLASIKIITQSHAVV